MFKKIPQDNVTRRLFTVHKENKLTQDDVDVYQVHDVTSVRMMYRYRPIGWCNLIVFLVTQLEDYTIQQN